MMNRHHKNNYRRRRNPRAMQRAMFRRPPPCPLLAEGITEVDYKDIDLLSRYITDEARVMPSSASFVSARMQRQLSRAIKQARYLALLPYTRSHTLERER